MHSQRSGLIPARAHCGREGLHVPVCGGTTPAGEARAAPRLVYAASGVRRVWCTPRLVYAASGVRRVWCTPRLVYAASGMRRATNDQGGSRDRPTGNRSERACACAGASSAGRVPARGWCRARPEPALPRTPAPTPTVPGNVRLSAPPPRMAHSTKAQAPMRMQRRAGVAGWHGIGMSHRRQRCR